MPCSPVVLLLLLVAPFALAAACPPAGSPGSRCECRTGTGPYDGGLHFVTCSGIDTADDLSLEMARFGGTEIEKLVLRDLVLTYLPHDAFRGLRVKSLELRDCTLVSLSDTDVAFEGLEESLVGVRFRDCSMTNSWEWASLRRLKALTTLAVQGGDLETVDAAGLRQLRHLKLSTVSFSSTQVYLVEEGAFAEFPELHDLSLKYDRISEVERSMFPDPAEKLRFLSLNHNEIRVLPVDLFTNMPRLEYLDVRENKLLTLKQETVAPVWEQLVLFETSGNPLRCDCRLKWVLERNPIRQMSIVCDEPRRFSGKRVTDLQPEDLRC